MICLTFDTDHLNEQRLTEFLQTHDVPGTATFFCTSPFACLDGSDHEISPHPFLPEGADWGPELAAKRQMFPDAVGWRSHSCVFSHLIARWLGENRYLYVSVDERFGQAGIKPNRHPMGTIWQIPIYYMDTFDISRQRFWSGPGVRPFDKALVTSALGDDGFYVFDFHPVHVLLNTPDPEFYFSVRDRFRAGEPIKALRYQGYGAGVFFQEATERMHAAGVRSIAIKEALAKYLAACGGESFV